MKSILVYQIERFKSPCCEKFLPCPFAILWHLSGLNTWRLETGLESAQVIGRGLYGKCSRRNSLLILGWNLVFSFVLLSTVDLSLHILIICQKPSKSVLELCLIKIHYFTSYCVLRLYPDPGSLKRTAVDLLQEVAWCWWSLRLFLLYWLTKQQRSWALTIAVLSLKCWRRMRC